MGYSECSKDGRRDARPMFGVVHVFQLAPSATGCGHTRTGYTADERERDIERARQQENQLSFVKGISGHRWRCVSIVRDTAPTLIHARGAVPHTYALAQLNYVPLPCTEARGGRLTKDVRVIEVPVK